MYVLSIKQCRCPEMFARWDKRGSSQPEKVSVRGPYMQLKTLTPFYLVFWFPIRQVHFFEVDPKWEYKCRCINKATSLEKIEKPRNRQKHGFSQNKNKMNVSNSKNANRIILALFQLHFSSISSVSQKCTYFHRWIFLFNLRKTLETFLLDFFLKN